MVRQGDLKVVWKLAFFAALRMTGPVRAWLQCELT